MLPQQLYKFQDVCGDAIEFRSGAVSLYVNDFFQFQRLGKSGESGQSQACLPSVPSYTALACHHKVSGNSVQRLDKVNQVYVSRTC